MSDWSSFPLIQSTGAMQPTPNEAQVDMTDPNARAALRVQRGVHPQMGRGETPDAALHALTMLAGGPAAGMGAKGAAWAFPQIAARLPGTVATAGSAGGLAALSTLPAAADEAVKQLQIMLRDAGHYRGPIDGKLGKGTQDAKIAFDKAEERKTAATGAETERLRVQTEAARVKEEAEARKQKGQQRAAGEKRFSEMEADVPWYRQGLRDYGSAAGYLLGGALGAGVRSGVVKAADAIGGRRAAQAEGMMGQNMVGIPSRAARVNEFWRAGGAGAGVPFTPTPGAAPGIAANPGAAGAHTLYQPSRAANVATDVAIPAGGMAESVAAEHYLAGPAREELAAANAAAQADPSEINLKRLQAAKDNDAIGKFSVNLGRGTAIGYGAQALHSRRAPTQPNVQPAEAERLQIERLLRAQVPGSAGPPRSSLPPTQTPPAVGTTTTSPASATLPPGVKQDAAGGWHGPDGRWITPPRP